MVGSPFNQDHLRMDGKVVIVTGANTGIGKLTALDLAKRGAKVYMACRDFKRCEAARLEIVEQSKNQNVFNRTLDLGSLQSIRKFARDFIAEETRLDVLVNNAGLMGPRRETVDGFEMLMGVNHMGHFLLTHLLLDLLKKSAPSRIVIVSSMAHRWGKLKKDDLNSEKTYKAFPAYCQSKLANLLFMRELVRRLEGSGVTVNAAHPGAVRTEISRDSSFSLAICLAPLFLLFMKNAELGAQTQIRLAVDPKLETVTGKYFSNCKLDKESKRAQNDEDALWLWNESVKWTTRQSA